MKIKHITDQEMWNSFVFDNTTDTFHQSWEWGDTHTSLNEKVWSLGVYSEQNKLVAVALTVLVHARRGSFLLIPHGPIFRRDYINNGSKISSIISCLIQHLKTLSQEQSCSFVRVAPTLTRTQNNTLLFKENGFINAPMFAQSELSWELDITPSEESLLKNMRKSTRNILKKNPAPGIVISSSDKTHDFDQFYDLYRDTVVSQGFFGQSEEFIKQEFESFSKTQSARLYFLHYKEALLATAMILIQNGSGFYHYGASQRSSDNIPAPHILQWHIIKDLKKQGCKRYNFWGICSLENERHPWRGLTIFKRGFGGEELSYVQTQDYVLKWTYWINWIIETTRRFKRGY